MADSIKVFLRFRPRNKMELNLNSPIAVEISSDNLSLKLWRKNEKEPKVFYFDYVFDWKTPQIKVYNTCAAELVATMLKGYNATIFAYGQTGSGKTWTMEGIPTPENMGLIPRMVGSVFETIENEDENLEFQVQISYVEIYMEKIKDLLDKSKDNLRVRQSKEKGVYIDKVTSPYVISRDEVQQVIDLGQAARAVTATKMNAGSSRSHAVVIFRVHTTDSRTGSKKMAKLMMVDLAGSEKTRKTEAVGTTLEEAKMINKSLSCLGMVISALGKKSKHCPYRDSKLTYLLSDSLGGNSLTSIVITGSPAKFNVDETISTCRFGTSCKAVKNKPKVNKEMSIREAKMLISKAKKREEELVKEVTSLKNVNRELKKAMEEAGLGDLLADILAKAGTTQSTPEGTPVPPEFKPPPTADEKTSEKPQKQEKKEDVQVEGKLEVKEPETSTLGISGEIEKSDKKMETKVEGELPHEEVCEPSVPDSELTLDSSVPGAKPSVPSEPDTELSLPPREDELSLPPREELEDTSREEKEDDNFNLSETEKEDDIQDHAEWKKMRKNYEERVQELEERNTALELHKNDLVEENFSLNAEMKTEHSNMEALKSEIETTRQQVEDINKKNEEMQLKLGNFRTKERKWVFREQEIAFQTKKFEDEIEDLKQQIETLKTKQGKITPERREGSVSAPPTRDELFSFDMKEDDELQSLRHKRNESRLSTASVEILTPIGELTAKGDFDDKDSAINFLKQENEKLGNKLDATKSSNKRLRDQLEEMTRYSEKIKSSFQHKRQKWAKNDKKKTQKLNLQKQQLNLKVQAINSLEVTVQAALQMVNRERTIYIGKIEAKETENANLRSHMKKLLDREKNPVTEAAISNRGIRKIKGGGGRKKKGRRRTSRSKGGDGVNKLSRVSAGSTSSGRRRKGNQRGEK